MGQTEIITSWQFAMRKNYHNFWAVPAKFGQEKISDKHKLKDIWSNSVYVILKSINVLRAKDQGSAEM